MALKTRIKKEQIENIGDAAKVMVTSAASSGAHHITTSNLASSAIQGIILGQVDADKIVTAGTTGDVDFTSTSGILNIDTLTASGNLDIGNHKFTARNLQADVLAAGRVVYTGTLGLLSEEAAFAYYQPTGTLSVTKIAAYEQAGAVDFSDEQMSNVNIDSGTIDGVAIGVASVVTDLRVDNLKVDGNTISSIDTDGNITISPQGTGSVNVDSSKIIGVSTPTDDTDAANKAYVDSVAQGLSAKDSVRVAPDNPISGFTWTLGVFTESSASGALTLDTIALASGDRVLIRSQAGAGNFAAHAQNGIYVVAGVDGSSAVTLTRSADLNSSLEAQAGAYFFVEEGSNEDAGFVLTTDLAITINTTALAFTQFSGAGQITADVGLSKIGNAISLNFNSSLADRTTWATGDKLACMDAATSNMHRQTIDALASKFAGAGMAASSAVIAVVNAPDGGLSVGTSDVKLDIGNLAANGAAGADDFDSLNDFIAIHDATTSLTKKISGEKFLGGCIDSSQMEVDSASSVIKISASALGMGEMGHISLQGRVIALSDQATSTEIVSSDGGTSNDYADLGTITYGTAHNDSAMNAVYLNGMRLTNKAGAAGDYVFAADASSKVKIVFQAGVLESGDMISWCIYKL